MIPDGRRDAEGAPAPPLLRLSGLSKNYGPITAVHPVDLDIEAGSFTAILGPSGCGKSTLLRMIAGFTEPTAGRVLIAGRDVTRLGPERRPTNMVFQGYGLFPHMTVAENIGFGLSIARTPKDEMARRVGDALRLVRLEDYAERSIDALSGGQQQRVALARALIMRPLVLLLDEPLAALDLKLRQAMQEELRRIHKEIGGTFIFVTHDQSEAFALADRLIVMNAGRVEQIGRPQQVYASPKSLFVAEFVGDTNIMEGYRRDGRIELDIGLSFASPGPEGAATFVLRPESVLLDEETETADSLQGSVEEILFLGNEARVLVALKQGKRLRVRVGEAQRAARFSPGMPVRIGWRRDALNEVARAT